MTGNNIIRYLFLPDVSCHWSSLLSPIWWYKIIIIYLIVLFCYNYLVAVTTGDGRGGGGGEAVLPLEPATMNGDGGGEAVVSLETATLNGDGRGGGDKVLSLAVVTLILCRLSPSWSLWLLLLQSGSSSSSLVLFQFQGNVLFLLSNCYSSMLLNSSSSSLPR